MLYTTPLLMCLFCINDYIDEGKTKIELLNYIISSFIPILNWGLYINELLLNKNINNE